MVDAVEQSLIQFIAVGTPTGEDGSAAQHQLPIIARDIPVFREVAGDYAFYFSGENADDLAHQ